MEKSYEKKVIGNPNDWHIEVYPKRAGDFSFCSISSVKYSTIEAESLARDMKNEIERHVNSVSGTSMIYESFICCGCNDAYDTTKEAEDCQCDTPPTEE